MEKAFNMHINKITFLIIFLFTISISTFAIESRPENFGAIPNDGIDDTAAIQAAIDEVLLQGGGTIVFPSGKLEVKGLLRLFPTDYFGADIKLIGSRGSIIEVSAGSDAIAFYAGNLNNFTFEDLVVTGKNVPYNDSSFFDAKYVVYSSSVQHTNIIRCQFYGLAVPSGGAIVYLRNTDAKIHDSQFDGNVGQYPYGSVVYAESATGLTVSRTTFLDYANLRGEYFSKSPAYTGAWIKVKGNIPSNALGTRRVLIEDSRFDEGAAIALHIEDVPWLVISGINVNVSGTTPGKGAYVKDVDYVKVEQSWFGYTPNTRPALDLLNVKALEVTSLKFGGGVYFWKKQNVTSTSIRFCDLCR